ncbi:MAG: D-alanine--D-alanine ligase [Verrucomicrobia bacterium]|nr:D-alanine--D-alanine ligase [Verrucomicrobiota bacterium]
MSSPFHNILVLCGGWSGEREVSLRSGAAVAEGLKSSGFHVQLMDILSPDWIIPDGMDVIFLALHGGYGEDGSIQQVLERQAIPFTGSGSAASRIAFDKNISKEYFAAHGIDVPSGLVLDAYQDNLPDGLSYPVILKPVADGSSLGLEFVDDSSQWSSALKCCLNSYSRVLVEEKISGREFTVGILDGQTLPLIEIIPQVGGYNYTNKYTQGGARHICPANVTPDMQTAIAQAGLRAFQSIGCRHYGRVDVLFQESRGPVVLEVNTLPGMTELSLFPEAAGVAGIPFPDLCRRMAELAWYARSST